MSRVALCLLAALAWISPARAHDARPVIVELQALDAGEVRAALRVPPSVDLDNRPVLRWPAGCTATPDGARCDPPLPGRALALHWPLYNPALVVAWHWRDGRGGEQWTLQLPGAAEWIVPREATQAFVLREYFRLGVEHILRGVDHLLFVAGLLLLAGTLRRAVVVVTGFTLAHSLTLSMAALGVIAPPVAVTEALIALSIAFLARELCLPHADTLARRQPALMAAGFGLLHGLGFAAALADTGLPPAHRALALFGFNLGVEAGQLAFIAALAGVATAVSAVMRRARPEGVRSMPDGVRSGPVVRVAGVALGLMAGYAFIERGVVAFTGGPAAGLG